MKDNGGEDETIKATLRILSGKSLEEKVEIIRAQLNVIVDVEEVKYPLTTLDGIIKSRFIEPCPICKAEIKPGKHCLACGKKGYVTAVEAEKILLKKSKENAKGG
ncbi:MAG: hypothetical protein AAB464_00035 [Patescibacteria group bacterium]